jgi:D-alanyl-D-alanine carboxypeptidase/D-alanyl-D-alanine-endopeptidase (penicillin-binding protein 4)
MKSPIVCLIFSIFIFACSPISKKALIKNFQDTEEKFQDHTGFILFDPETNKTLFEYNAAKYFTPGSNTKIFTFFTSLKILGDSVPGLKYVIKQDSLIFQGTGDPSFLYKNAFNNNRIFYFLKDTEQTLYFSSSNFETTNFGRGWAWDDYNDYYSAERSPFPVYGDIFTVFEGSPKFTTQPVIFSRFLNAGNKLDKAKVVRDPYSNQTTYNPGKVRKNKIWDIPYKVEPLFTTELLSDTLLRPVFIADKRLPIDAPILYSTPIDSLYQPMMQESDNFIAEQLLLMCAGVISDTLKPEIAIRYAKQNFLNDLSDEPIWADGSGLSRYNLFTPRSIVQVWNKIYKLVPPQRLYSLLATGGKAGTLRNWFKANNPYIFGKTGTLSNNHSLSGFLITQKGKTLIFAFMNNNYTAPVYDVRKNMQEILDKIYKNY